MLCANLLPLRGVELQKNHSELPVSSVGIAGHKRLFKQMWTRRGGERGASRIRDEAAILRASLRDLRSCWLGGKHWPPARPDYCQAFYEHDCFIPYKYP